MKEIMFKKVTTQADLLALTLTYESGRNSFRIEETNQLIKIAFLEGKELLDEMEIEIKDFKSKFRIEPDDWLTFSS